VGKGAKIAIGCFVVLLVGAVAAGVMVIGGVWWAKGKAEQYGGQITKTANDLAKYEKEANANPFTRPADGAFTEDRLLKFLEVRRQIYSVYETHRADLEASKKKQQADLGDLVKFGSLVTDIKLTQEKAQAQVGMSDGEYIFMAQAVYGAQMNSALQKETGKTASQTFDAAVDQSKQAMRDAARQAPGNGQIDEKTLADAEEQANEAKKTIRAFDAPQSNIDLYRKHEDEIKKFTMEGLGVLGL
jgi:hypothetical protein